MSREQTSAWSDWLPLHMGSAVWTTTDVPSQHLRPSTRLNFGFITGNVVDAGGSWNDDRVDQISGRAEGTIPKPTFDATATIYAAFQIPIPDYVVTKQPSRLTPWGGRIGDEMQGAGNGRNLALQVELVLNRVWLGNAIPGPAPGTPGSDLTTAGFVAKYRGYGARDSVNDNAETQDAPIAPSWWDNNSIFDDMALPSSGNATQNAAATFAPDGLCRLQAIFLLPATLALGDVVELTTFANFAQDIINSEFGTSRAMVQFYGMKYRWINADFTPFPVNTAIQLMGQTKDAGGDALDQQLEGQSRADILPYEP